MVTISLIEKCCYICNKNLVSEGNPDHFIGWTKVLQMGHPSNAVISLFLFIAYRLVEDHEAAETQKNLTRSILDDSSYWRDRFDQYGLAEIIRDPGSDKLQVQKQIRDLRRKYEEIF